MKPHHFIKKVDHACLQDAIQRAEAGNSADIVLYISHERVADPYVAAEKVFQALGLNKTVEQLSLLFFIAPETRQLAVIGSQPLHERLGEKYWHELVDILSSHFRSDRYTDGLKAAIESAGLQLRAHFPSTSSGPRGLGIVEE